MSHATADILWHNLANVSPTGQGFIQTLANLNFQGNYDAAHNVADVGGEFVLATSYNLSFVNDWWYLPTADLIQIYRSLNFTDVEEIDLIEGNTLLYAEVQAFRYADYDKLADLLFLYAKKSPFLMEEIETYWLGGISDMSGWTNKCWQDIKRWLIKGTDNNICLVDYSVSHRKVVKMYNWESMRHQIKGVKFDRGYKIYQIDSRPRVDNKKFSRWGSSLATTGTNLVVGAPGYWTPGNFSVGKIQIFTEEGNYSLTGTETGSRFGDGIAVVDLNRDGIPDLAVSAPGTGWGQLFYGGVINIFWGPVRGRMPDCQIGVDNLAGAYTNLGSKLFGFDVDGDGYSDLVIGSPYACRNFSHQCTDRDDLQSGMVAIFLASKFYPCNFRKILTADWLKWGESKYSGFGYHVNLMIRNNHRILLIGAPTIKGGKLYAYSKDVKLWEIEGTGQFDKLGSHTSYSPELDYLAISLPTRSTEQGLQYYWQAGTVLLLSPRHLSPNTSYQIDDLIPRGILFQSTLSFGRFGWQTGWSPNAFWISKPWGDEGRVYGWYLDKGFNFTTTTEKSADITYTGLVRGAKFGYSMIFPSPDKIVVGSPGNDEFKIIKLD